jgi:hypothetical protein
MTDFVVERDGATVEDAVYDVSPLTDTANPFGDFAVVKIDDRGGQKFPEYERGTRIDIGIDDSGAEALTIQSSETVTTEAGTTDAYATVTNAGTYSNAGTVTSTGNIDRFTGYVVERRELDQQGADALEVEAYSFDQFLRRNTVSNDQTGNLISEAIADIIQTDTPVSYVAANVDVNDDQELTRSYRGETVEATLRDLAFKSGNEAFGVNDDLEFFFRPRETVHIDRGIDNTQWFNYDIPELGKEAINEVEVWFDDGEESVIVDDGTDKLDLQENLGLPSPGTQRAEINRPLITDITDAEDIGRKYLAFRNATLSGTVTTYGLFDAEPGDTIDITIDPRGIDAEFVIAAIRYRWGVDETELTIVENRGDVDDILTEISESVQRVEMNGANRDAPKNRITTTNATGIVSVGVDAGGTAADADRFVNDGRRAMRDTWTGESPPTIDTIAVGSDGSGLSRSNTDLQNQTNSASATETLPDATSVEYAATLTQTGVEEVGLFAADGTLITRATFESPVDIDGTVTVTLGVANDDSVSRGVLTTDGQTAVRDVLADNSPALPDEYAYGSDGTAVAESDTALANEVVRTSLDELLIQSASTNSEWSSIVSPAADAPLAVQNDRLEHLQAAFTTESDQLTRSGTGLQQNDNFSNDEAERIGGSGESLSLTFTLDYTIPEADVGVWVRLTTAASFDGQSNVTGPELTLSLNGDTWTPVGSGAGFGTLDWRDLGNNTFGGTGTYAGGDLTPGTYTLTIEGTSAGDGQDIDVVAPLDNRQTFTFDETEAAGARVSGPELYPQQTVQALDTATTRRNVPEARFVSTWNDTTNSQFVELANDGSTFTRINNADSGTVTFASAEQGIDTNLALSRFGTDATATPTDGRQGQYISEWELYATINAVVSDGIGETLARAIVQPNTITGETIREAGLFGDGNLLTRHELAEFEVLSDQRLSSSETSLFTGDN